MEGSDDSLTSRHRARDDEFDPYEEIPPDDLVFVGDGDFRVVGELFVDHLLTDCGLKPTDRVLDVGCGIGRMALPLLRVLRDEGSYVGIDVVPFAIEWCMEHIESKYPNFRFDLLDVKNMTYNPNGTLDAAEVTFPYPNSVFDIVLLASVFTHMFPSGVERYMSEIARVMAPGARSLITFFICDAEARRLMEEKKSSLDFSHELESWGVKFFTIDPANPEAAIAYEEDWVRHLYDEVGLVIDEPIRRGYWPGRSVGYSYQDVVFAARA